jgi:hypothetical protein
MYLFGRFPTVMSLGITSPLKEILKLLSMPMSPRVQDLFYFVFFFPSCQVRWQFWEIYAVLFCLFVRQEETGMENRVHLFLLPL